VRVAVLGLSDFGFPLAVRLREIGNEVIAVDRNTDVVQRIKDFVDSAVVADVTDRAALDELGFGELDAVLVSIGRRLEATVLLTHYLREAGVPRIFVKVADEEQGEILRLVGASDVVQPDREIAARVAARMTFPQLVDGMVLCGEARIVAVKALDRWVGLTVAEFHRVHRSLIRVIAIDPAPLDVSPIVPAADYRIGRDDTLVILGAAQDLFKEVRE
jgi:trk system potassium uptake protein TrkA